MPSKTSEQFIRDSAEKSFDQHLRNTMNQHSLKYNEVLEKGTEKFFDLENSKNKANLIKWKTIENLDRYLLAFETNFSSNGGQVIWANDIQEAHQEIWKILEKNRAKTVFKSKSLVLEELDLNSFMETNGIEVINSAFEEYTSSSSNEFGIDKAQEQNVELSNYLREKLWNADVSITGANFLIAENGSIAISENEGNIRIANTYAKTHIIICGIEKILPSLSNLNLFWPLLASHATGQSLATYNTILTGPRRSKEEDGPEEMYVILLDNGRTNLLSQKEQRQGLYCIQCGSCLHVCPVYNTMEEQTYGTTYKGPIGSVITPHTQGMKAFKHLSEASTLCGKCTEVCPVNIDIHRMLLLNRKDAVDRRVGSSSELKSWKLLTFITKKRKWLDVWGGKIKNFFLRYFFNKTWGKRRELPPFPKQSFSKQWKESQKKKE